MELFGNESGGSVSQTSGSSNISIDRLIVEAFFGQLTQGVVFSKTDGTVLYWSQSAVDITGLPAESMLGQKCFIDQMESYYDDGDSMELEGSPFQRCIESKSKVETCVTIYHQGGKQISAEMQFLPVGRENADPVGVVIVIQDLTNEADLRDMISKMDSAAKKDPLTKVATRSAFEEKIGECMSNFHSANTKSCLVICDIDFFKRINDDYGHHIGDLALVSFAQHLEQFVREEDMVARYGGEEFVIVFNGCDQSDAFKRTEKIRRSLELKALPELGGKCLTASFGIAETSTNDSCESIFVRADQALLRAKEEGRNRVLCTEGEDFEISGSVAELDDADWLNFPHEHLLQKEFITPAPIDVLATKIKGFVEEQQANILQYDSGHIALSFGGEQSLFRRGSDQTLGLLVDIEMKRPEPRSLGRSRGSQTNLRITIRAKNKRDRRRQDIGEAAAHLLQTIRSYLMLDDGSSLNPERAATSPGDGRS